MQFATATDVGRVRQRNEDFVFAGRVPGAADATLLVVADGLGGHEGGEWASRRGVELVVAGLPVAFEAAEDNATALGRLLETASAALHAETVAGQGPVGAGTTLVAGLVQGNELWWANIGDSRLYLITASAAAQLTVDHSWVQEQVAAGLLSREQADRHPRRNLITRAAGLGPAVVADAGGPAQLRAGDVVLLCSDGVSGVLTLETIAGVARASQPQEAAAELIRLGNAAGGPDNLTVAVYRA